MSEKIDETFDALLTEYSDSQADHLLARPGKLTPEIVRRRLKADEALNGYVASLLRVAETARDTEQAWCKYFVSRNLLPRDPEKEDSARDDLRDCVVRIRQTLAALPAPGEKKMTDKQLYDILKPEAVNWICCDGCDRHFHRDEMTNTQTFNFCRKCMDRRAPGERKEKA